MTTAGDLIVWEQTEGRGRNIGSRPRQGRQQGSSEEQRSRNQLRSWQQLELLLATNFRTPGSAIVCTLTFRDDRLPHRRRETLARMAYFRRKLRESCLAEGHGDPRIVWAPEVLTSESGRWHLHAVAEAFGEDFARIRRCWIYGDDLELEPLRIDEHKNHETLARYMTKELRDVQDYESRPGLHGWSCTRNCLRPTVETLRMPDGFELPRAGLGEVLPEFGVVVDLENRESAFGSYRRLMCRSAESWAKG